MTVVPFDTVPFVRTSMTVTICVPLASRAAAIASFDENFPVPTSSRERNSRPAMRSGSVVMGCGR